MTEPTLLASKTAGSGVSFEHEVPINSVDTRRRIAIPADQLVPKQ